MKRKIIKQGHNTLTITLPSEWAKRFNLRGGKEVELIEKDNGLFVSVEKQGEEKKAEFDISEMDIPTIWKYFMAVYREGYNELKVTFNPKQEIESPYKYFSQHRLDLRYKKQRDKITTIDALQRFSNRFVDFEIVETGKGYVIIKEMGETSSKEFDNSIRRIFLLLQQMAEEVLESVKTGDKEIISRMHDVDINLDKFHDYCIRILNKTGNKEPRKTSILFTILYLLELIGDEYKNIAIHIIQDFAKTSLKNLEGIASSAKKQIDTIYDLFYKFDIQKISNLSEIDRENYFSIPSLYKKSNEQEKEVYHHLRMISRYINSILELRIEMEF